MWRTSSEEPFTAFRDRVRSAANGILYHRGRLSALIHNIAEDVPVTNQIDDLVGAIMKKMGYQLRNNNNANDRTSGGGGGPNQPRSERKTKWANCGSENHTARECDKPRVPDNKRP